jgi:hypothetical protein
MLISNWFYGLFSIVEISFIKLNSTIVLSYYGTQRLVSHFLPST